MLSITMSRDRIVKGPGFIPATRRHQVPSLGLGIGKLTLSNNLNQNDHSRRGPSTHPQRDHVTGRTSQIYQPVLGRLWNPLQCEKKTLIMTLTLWEEVSLYQ